jgi:hypothetical protein
MEKATIQPLPEMPEADSRPPSPLQDVPPAVENRLIYAADRIAKAVSCVAAG